MSLDIQQSAHEYKKRKKETGESGTDSSDGTGLKKKVGSSLMHCDCCSVKSWKHFWLSAWSHSVWWKTQHSWGSCTVPKWKISGRKQFSSSVVPAQEAAICKALKKELKFSVGEKSTWPPTSGKAGKWRTPCLSQLIGWIMSSRDVCPDWRLYWTWEVSAKRTRLKIGEKLDSIVESWLPPLGLEPGYVATDNARNVPWPRKNVNMKRIQCLPHFLIYQRLAWLWKSF